MLFRSKQVHFYTSSADERDAVIANSYAKGTSYSSLSGNGASSEPSGSGWGYRYEGVAWSVSRGLRLARLQRR